MTRSIIILIVFIVILAGGGYYLYRGFGNHSATANSAESRVAIQTRLADLRRLRNLTLDTSILRDRFFLSLHYTGPATTTELKSGKPNPFLP